MKLASSLYQNRPLRVLQIHNFYQQPGGEDVVVQHEADLLQQAGVELYTWYVYSSALPEKATLFGKLQLAWRSLWNRLAQQQLKQRLQAQPVDIIHLHNAFPLLSPAIIHTASQLKVPLVMTVHNFRWCHPSGCIQTLADVNTNSWRYLGQRLYRNSSVATALLVLQIQLHHWLGSYQRCARLLCPSQFVKTALLHAGFDEHLLDVKPHSVANAVAGVDSASLEVLADHIDTIDNTETKQTIESGYALFVGRADAAKGLDFLLHAWQDVSYPLWVVGVSEQQAQALAGNQQNSWVRFLGYQSAEALAGFYQQATLLVVPSFVAETFGNVVIEAFSHGTPCLVSNIGALPELLQPRHNSETADDDKSMAGQVFVPGDQNDFLYKLKLLLDDPDRRQRMSQQARQLYRAYYLPQHNQQALLACYQQVLSEQGNVVGG